MFKPIIRSRHPSHNRLRKELPFFPKRVLLRLGSTHNTPLKHKYLEINSSNACKNSANKRIMKQCFNEYDIPTCKYSLYKIDNLKYPIIAKPIYGSRAKDIFLLRDEQNYNKLKFSNYIFEEYFSGVREYRIHVSKNGCFHACRKLLKSTATTRFYRNSNNSNWILENNKMFEKPINWEQIVNDCVKALNAVNLDIGACDVRVQSQYKNGEIRNNPIYKIIEINSAPSLNGNIVFNKYKTEITKIINNLIK